MNKVFVYGTLRKEEEPTHILPDYDMHVCRGKNFAFPYAVPGNGCIYGELVEVDDKDLQELDRYENIRSGLYKRVELEVEPYGDLGDYELVWVYVAGPALLPEVVESGNWNDFLNKEK